MLFDNYPFSIVGFPFSDIAMYLAVAFTIISGADYFRLNKEVFKQLS
jgi:CDP-diacylglycerol--glycerol-3-phosphate 3-phosphatidyltransferase